MPETYDPIRRMKVKVECGSEVMGRVKISSPILAQRREQQPGVSRMEVRLFDFQLY